MDGENVIVVTGASAGVGRATVRAFARRHGGIGLLARGRDGLEAARQEVEEAGGKALVLPTDVSDFDQVDAAAVEQTFGPIDIWVNNAMVSVFSPAKEMTPAEFKRVTDVTYSGYDAHRPNNLCEPVAGDHGTHGDFEKQSRNSNLQVWLDRRRGWVTAAAAFAALLGVALSARNNTSRLDAR